jgi:hypothetical protein
MNILALALSAALYPIGMTMQSAMSCEGHHMLSLQDEWNNPPIPSSNGNDSHASKRARVCFVVIKRQDLEKA